MHACSVIYCIADAMSCALVISSDQRCTRGHSNLPVEQQSFMPLQECVSSLTIYVQAMMNCMMRMGA